MASRNAKRAESLWSRPRARPAPIVTPSRLMPATSAVDWAAPTRTPRDTPSCPARAPRRPWRPPGPPVRAPARDDGTAQPRTADQPVDHQEDRRHFRLRGQRAQLVLEREADDARRDARDDDQPRHPLVDRLGAAGRQRVEERADDFDPVAPVEDQQAERAADVQHHDEREPERLGFGLQLHEVVPAEQRREQHRVAEAGDREQLGHALQNAEHDRLEVADRGGGQWEREGSTSSATAYGPAAGSAGVSRFSSRPPAGAGERLYASDPAPASSATAIAAVP